MLIAVFHKEPMPYTYLGSGSGDDDSFAPTYTNYLTSRRVQRGDTLTMSCGVSGTPRPEVDWTRDGQVDGATVHKFEALRSGMAL